MRTQKGHLLTEFAIAAVIMATTIIPLKVAMEAAVREEGDRVTQQTIENAKEYIWLQTGRRPTTEEILKR